jgi:hypothetical protein
LLLLLLFNECDWLLWLIPSIDVPNNSFLNTARYIVISLFDSIFARFELEELTPLLLLLVLLLLFPPLFVLAVAVVVAGV